MEPTKKPNEVATGDEPSEVERLKEEVRREHEMYLRALADFDRALEHMDDAPLPVSEGFHAIHRKLLGLLEAHGVIPLKSLGEAFNPELHEAIGSAQSGKCEPGTVIDEVRRGYRWGDEVLRPARVRVAQ